MKNQPPKCDPSTDQCVECYDDIHCDQDGCEICNMDNICVFDCDEGECCDGSGDCVLLSDWSDHAVTGTFEPPPQIIEAVENAIKKIVDDVDINTVKGTLSGQAKDCCESDGIGIIEDGERYKQGSLTVSAELAGVPIWEPADISWNFDFGFAEIWIDFSVGVFLNSDFSVTGTLGKRWDDCSDPAEDCLYGSVDGTISIGLNIELDFIVCQETLWTSKTCVGATVVPAEIQANFSGTVSYNSKDSCDEELSGSITLGEIVFKATFKVNGVGVDYTYTIYDGL